MALPNATKTNYGNVDDLTPTEMNDIGSNLISLGQKILKVVDDTWILTNADHDGVNFIRIDIAKAATALQIGIDGSKTAWNVVAGANPIVWVQGEKWDTSGTLVAGSIKQSLLFEYFSASSTIFATTVIVGNVNVGDIIIANAVAFGTTPTFPVSGYYGIGVRIPPSTAMLDKFNSNSYVERDNAGSLQATVFNASAMGKVTTSGLLHVQSSMNFNTGSFLGYTNHDLTVLKIKS